VKYNHKKEKKTEEMVQRLQAGEVRPAAIWSIYATQGGEETGFRREGLYFKESYSLRRGFSGKQRKREEDL